MIAPAPVAAATSPPSPFSASQTVERIREIIVGRHLEKLEKRLQRLEQRPVAAAPPPVSSLAHAVPLATQVPSIFEDRLLTTEAHLEALREKSARLESEAREALSTAEEQRAQVARLASQIQEVVRDREATLPAVERLEQRLGHWLGQWQCSLQNHLAERDQRLLEEVRREISELRHGLEQRFGNLEHGVGERVEARFNRIAEAAKALAASALGEGYGQADTTNPSAMSGIAS